MMILQPHVILCSINLTSKFWFFDNFMLNYVILFEIQRNADPESVFLSASSRQLEPRPNRARARNQHGARPTHHSPRAALRHSIVQHDGRRRPAALSRSSVHARRQRERESNNTCTPRGTTETSIKLTLSPHEILSFLNLQSTIHISVIIIDPSSRIVGASSTTPRGCSRRTNLSLALRLLSSDVGQVFFFQVHIKVFVVVSAVKVTCAHVLTSRVRCCLFLSLISPSREFGSHLLRLPRGNSTSIAILPISENALECAYLMTSRRRQEHALYSQL